MIGGFLVAWGYYTFVKRALAALGLAQRRRPRPTAPRGHHDRPDAPQHHHRHLQPHRSTHGRQRRRGRRGPLRNHPMPPSYQTDLYRRLRAELDTTPIIDCHEHLQRERELPAGQDVHIGRFFAHYANCDLVQRRHAAADMARVQERPAPSPRERWKLLEPWYARPGTPATARRCASPSATCTASRTSPPPASTRSPRPCAPRSSPGSRAGVRPGRHRLRHRRSLRPQADLQPRFRAGLLHLRHGRQLHRAGRLAPGGGIGLAIRCLDDYLEVIDFYFERDGKDAGAFKVGRAYDRTLFWEDVPRARWRRRSTACWPSTTARTAGRSRPWRTSSCTTSAASAASTACA